MVLIDSRKAPLQLNFLNHGSVHMMSEKLYMKMLASDEGLFHDYILPLISKDMVSKLYSERNDVRPANYAINHVAAAIFVRMTGLTEENFIEQLPWNIKYQHAIGIEQWSDDIAFSEKTFSSFRKRIKDYNDAQMVQFTSVGPTLSAELFRMSFIALLAAIIGIIAYISFRFEFKYAVSAILGLIHDVTFVMGVFSLLGVFFNVEVDGLFLTAMLTVIGYSVNDTIVVYDRIRENLRYYGKKMSFGEIVDASVQQTITRSINTSMTTFLALGALYFFGGVTTKDFVLAMMLGVLIGTYSSIFFCSMLVDFWTERANAPKKPAIAE